MYVFTRVCLLASCFVGKIKQKLLSRFPQNLDGLLSFSVLNLDRKTGVRSFFLTFTVTFTNIATLHILLFRPSYWINCIRNVAYLILSVMTGVMEKHLTHLPSLPLL